MDSTLGPKGSALWIKVRRVEKADLIAQAARDTGYDARSIVHLTPDERHRIERMAGVREGSRQTWQVAARMLAGSVQDDALCVTCGRGDPEGLPIPPQRWDHLGKCSQ